MSFSGRNRPPGSRRFVSRPEADRFWEKVEVLGPDECWPWIGGRIKGRSYGMFNRGDGRFWTAHRVAFELENGPFEQRFWVLHTCDNPPCCNPAHLFLGDPRSNAADRSRKGRTRPRKLSVPDALTIFASSEPRRLLAERFDVSVGTVRNVQIGKTYAQITGAARC